MRGRDGTANTLHDRAILPVGVPIQNSPIVHKSHPILALMFNNIVFPWHVKDLQI